MSRQHVSAQSSNKTTGNTGPTDPTGSLITVKRFDASCNRVISSANLVCAFRYSTEGKKWDKLNIEGPLFLYERDAQPPFALFILNKNSLRNWGCVLDETSELQERDRYLLIQVRSDIPSGNAANVAAKGIHMICFRSVSKCQEFCNIIRDNTKLNVLVVDKNQNFSGLKKNDGMEGAESGDGGDDMLNSSLGENNFTAKPPNIMDSPLTTAGNISTVDVSSNSRNMNNLLTSHQQSQPFGKQSVSTMFAGAASASPSHATPKADLQNLQQYLKAANNSGTSVPGGSYQPGVQQHNADSLNNQATGYFKPFMFGGPERTTGALANMFQQTRQNQLQQPGMQTTDDGSPQQDSHERDVERERMFAKLDHNLLSARAKKTGNNNSKHDEMTLGSSSDLISLAQNLEIADKSAPGHQQQRSKSNASAASSNLAYAQQNRPHHPPTSIEQLLNISGITAANLAQILKDAGLKVNTASGEPGAAGDTNGRARVGGDVLSGLRHDYDGYSGGSSSAEYTITGNNKHKRTDSGSTIGSRHTVRGGGGGDDDAAPIRSISIGSNNNNVDSRLLGLGLTEAQFSAAFRFMLSNDEPFVKDLLFTTFKPVMGEPEFINKLHRAYSSALAEQFGLSKK